MTEEYIDVPVQRDKETMNKINRMTKKELIERFGHAAVEAQVATLRCQTALPDCAARLRCQTALPDCARRC